MRRVRIFRQVRETPAGVDYQHHKTVWVGTPSPFRCAMGYEVYLDLEEKTLDGVDLLLLLEEHWDVLSLRDRDIALCDDRYYLRRAGVWGNLPPSEEDPNLFAELYRLAVRAESSSWSLRS